MTLVIDAMIPADQNGVLHGFNAVLHLHGSVIAGQNLEKCHNRFRRPYHIAVIAVIAAIQLSTVRFGPCLPSKAPCLCWMHCTLSSQQVAYKPGGWSCKIFQGSEVWWSIMIPRTNYQPSCKHGMTFET